MSVTYNKKDEIMKLHFAPIALSVLLTFSLIGCSGKAPDEHLAAALEFRAEGQHDAAIIELKNAVQQAPKNAQFRFELGNTYMQISDFESAEKELGKALELGFDANQVFPLLSAAYQRTRADVALSKLDINNSNLTPIARLRLAIGKLSPS